MIKRFVRKALRSYGYEIIQIQSSTSLFQPNKTDKAMVQPFLDLILPEIEKNVNSRKWPTPDDMRGYFNPRRFAMTRLILEECEKIGIKFDKQKIIDVGCHAGLLLHFIQARYSNTKLYGCDILEDKLNMARKAVPSANIFFSSFDDLSQNDLYDVVFCTEVLEHLVDPETALRKLVSQKSDQGVVIVTVPDGRENRCPAKLFSKKFQSFGGHINFWSPESWQYFLCKLFGEKKIQTTKIKTGNLFAVIH